MVSQMNQMGQTASAVTLGDTVAMTQADAFTGAADATGTATGTTYSVDASAAVTAGLSIGRAMTLRRPENRVGLAVGGAFGFLLVASGFGDPAVVHEMLLLRSPDLYLMFASVVATALPLLWLLERRKWHTRYGGAIDVERVPVARRHVLGALVFGTGWAIAGTCPGPALALTATGNLLGVAVMAGLFSGLLLREAVKRRLSAPQS